MVNVFERKMTGIYKVDNIGDSGVKLRVYIMVCYCLGNYWMNFDHFVASLGSL